MAVIITIETSTTVCSAALEKDGVCLMQKIDFAGQNHARMLPKFIEELTEEVKKRKLKVDAVAMSCGPGSYTGLRIGSSTTKGLCYGWGVPMIAIPTLEVMSMALLHSGEVEKGDVLCPMIDARRMEVYAAMYDKNLNELRATAADIVDETSYADVLKEHKVVFFGNGADKCKDTIKSENAVFVEGVYPSAESMIALAEKRYAEGRFEDEAYFEPFYLKQFIAVVPKPLI